MFIFYFCRNYCELLWDVISSIKSTGCFKSLNWKPFVGFWTWKLDLRLGKKFKKLILILFLFSLFFHISRAETNSPIFLGGGEFPMSKRTKIQSNNAYSCVPRQIFYCIPLLWTKGFYTVLRIYFILMQISCGSCLRLQNNGVGSGF